MRILHTSDWHLGKYLESHSRLDEQKEFLEELVELTERQKIDLIIIAGDVYDTINPPANAEQLFYKSIKKLSDGGKRPILIIAGNHDNPDRLTAASPLATEMGIILLGTPKSVAVVGAYEHFSIVKAGEGFVEVRLKGETVVAITIPYPSEKRLNEMISEETEEKEIQKSYSQKIGQVFEGLSKQYREDTINIATGHFYITGSETSKSERDIQLGGSYAVETKELPKAQYIAMGHLHRPQRIKCAAEHAYYSGSPIQYSKSEANYAKCVYVADIQVGQSAVVEKIYLRNYKPIEIWKVNGFEEALEKCEKHKDESSWVFLEIQTDRVLLQSEIKSLRTTKKDIIEIAPILLGSEETVCIEEFLEKSLGEEFFDFYKSNRKTAPSDEVMEMFLTLCYEA